MWNTDDDTGLRDAGSGVCGEDEGEQGKLLEGEKVGGEEQKEGQCVS